MLLRRCDSICFFRFSQLIDFETVGRRVNLHPIFRMAELRAAVTDKTLSITDATAIQRYLAAMGNPYELNTEVTIEFREK